MPCRSPMPLLRAAAPCHIAKACVCKGSTISVAASSLDFQAQPVLTMLTSTVGMAAQGTHSEIYRSPSRSSDNALFRTLEFWRRAGGIYFGYKLAQSHAQILRWRGMSEQDIKEQHWRTQNDRSGKQMYDLCVDLRGFFLKAGQFIGARSDFVPEDVCVHLRKLQDEVPPMPPREAEAILKQELRVQDLSTIFEWIDLDKPLGSASIAQALDAYAGKVLGSPSGMNLPVHVVQSGETAWSISNGHGLPLEEFIAVNQSLDMHTLQPGDPGTAAQAHVTSVDAVKRVNTAKYSPKDDLVAVKVQYPDALSLFIADLGNIRRLAAFLTKTEFAFDLVSAVDELSSQVKLEFDFQREARVMDTTCTSLSRIRNRVVVPHSIPGLVTNRVLTMTYLQGVPLTKLQDRLTDMPQYQQKAAFKMIIRHASEAYGRMILETGLFQADGHPGNMLAMEKGVVGLIDYGQSKQITEQERLQFARLVVALAEDNSTGISCALEDMGIKIDTSDVALAAQHGKNMFDTAGQIDVFSEDSPLKKAQISEFPKDFFLILRVVQLFRGLASRMDVEFSTAKQWQPFAKQALKEMPEEKALYNAIPERTGKFYGI